MKSIDAYLYEANRSHVVENMRRKSENVGRCNESANRYVRVDHRARSKSDLAVRSLERSYSTPETRSELEDSAIQKHGSSMKEEIPELRSKLAGSVFQKDSPDTMSHEAKPPLTEISTNSPTKPSLAKPPQIPQQEINNVITSIISKRPSSATSSDPNDKKRSGRIFGRAASNMSAGSRGRESSVDSTASHGNPVHWPEHPQFNTGGWDEGVPPQTQMKWVEDEGAEIKERVVARMMGEKVERKGMIKERAVTLGDINSAAPRRGARRAGGR